MTQSERFIALVNVLAKSLVPLPDKPDESVNATARALWFAAADQACSIERAQREPIPPLTEDGVLRLERLVEKRLDGVPLAHLTGRQSFMGLELLAGPEALVPRRETEILAKAALGKVKTLVQERGHVRAIDVCTGSGNLALALAFHEPNATIFAADLSLEATALARRNVALHHMDDRVIVRDGDLFAPFSGEDFHGQVDLVVCNPPYVSSGKVKALPSEISQHEPALAFDGGPLGVTILSRLLKEAPAFLKPNSWLCFETGLGQGDHFRRSLSRIPEFSQVETFADENGATRALAAKTHSGPAR
jgi:release factor glutamine methyltransferase